MAPTRALEKAGAEFIENDGVRLTRDGYIKRIEAAGGVFVKGSGKGVVITTPGPDQRK